MQLFSPAVNMLFQHASLVTRNSWGEVGHVTVHPHDNQRKRAGGSNLQGSYLTYFSLLFFPLSLLVCVPRCIRCLQMDPPIIGCHLT